MRKYYILLCLAISVMGVFMTNEIEAVENLYLYKILSKADWAVSEQLGYLKPQAQDTEFIHLAERDQIDRIVIKFYPNRTDILIAKIDADKIIGRLVHEANPGGTNKYYHLYDGKIPLDAVIEIYPYVKN